MGGLRDILNRAFGGRSPEAALADFKERLHAQINEFKENPETRSRLQRMLQSILAPLQQANTFVVRPALADNERLKSMAQRYGVNKVELKRMLKTSLELEDTLRSYFEDSNQVDQLILTLRKVVNVIDEDLVTSFIDAIDYNIDYSKIEKAYLDYQSNLQKAYNADGLNRDLQGLMGTVMQNLKGAFNSSSKPPKIKASDRQAEARMLEPELQNLYNRYREEGFTHEESMRVVDEKRDLDQLPEAFMEAYRTLRREGRNHAAALEYARNLADKAAQKASAEAAAKAPGQAVEIPIERDTVSQEDLPAADESQASAQDQLPKHPEV